MKLMICIQAKQPRNLHEPSHRLRAESSKLQNWKWITRDLFPSRVRVLSARMPRPKRLSSAASWKMPLSYRSTDRATDGPIRCCPRGHPLTDDNIGSTKSGKNFCRLCKTAMQKKYRAAHADTNGKTARYYHRRNAAASMPSELEDLRVAIFDLRSAAMQATAKKYGGDASHRWRKEFCIRGHPRYGPEARIRNTGGKSNCLICDDYLRRKRAAENRAAKIARKKREMTLLDLLKLPGMRKFGGERRRPHDQRMYCKNGHPMFGHNLFTYGVRKQTKCRICFYARKREYYKQNREVGK